MHAFTRNDLRTAIEVLHSFGEACASAHEFYRHGLSALTKIVPADLITLSVSDFDTSHRSVMSNPASAISSREIEVFDHFFHVHPLVRVHGRNPHAGTYRISDLLPKRDFHRTPLYNEYYRPIRIDHVMAVPVHIDSRFVVGFVLNRSGRGGFSDRDRKMMDLLRPNMTTFYRLCLALDDARTAGGQLRNPDLQSTHFTELVLTAREREVLDWLAAGKTNRDIAAILGRSTRTVEKHLERIYQKLGVETRTAAVMRSRLIYRPGSRPADR
jgi:DNA-binding CsgD family transcriptional regulator